MDSLLLRLLFIVSLVYVCQSQTYTCSVGDPCGLDSYPVSKGYGCFQRGDSVLCRCPNGESEINEPCRLCARNDSRRNVCNVDNPKMRICLEATDHGSPYVCMCEGGIGGALVATTSWDCDISNPLTTRSTTTISTSTPSVCANGGVFLGIGCRCPSGYGGQFCELSFEGSLCNAVTCLNGAYPSIRPVNGQRQCICPCRSGFSGEYCELTGTLATCATHRCTNGGACREVTVATTTHAYCDCPPGYNGTKCETRYFNCTVAGLFADSQRLGQGKYFECVASGTTFRAIQRSCPKGLQYNDIAKQCI